MKILILSCNTGEGHNSAGRAVREALRARGAECDMIDSLQFGFKGESFLISNGHVWVYRHIPRAFGAVYRGLEKHKWGGDLVYRANTGKLGAAEKLRSFLKLRGYDAVVCVHVFPASEMTYLRSKYGPEFLQYFIPTDYTCSPGVGELDMDAFFTPHRFLSGDFVRAGVPADRIQPTGIPVSGKFLAPRDRAGARSALGLNPDLRSILLMGGSMGAGPMFDLAKAIGQKLPEDGELLVLCGRNERFREQLQQLGLPRVQAIGYSDQVERYMDASELLLTKAGGLSSTEALMKRLPLLFVSAIPGLEIRNQEFLMALDCADSAKGVKGLAARALELLGDPQSLEALRSAQERHFRLRAADDIAAAILRDGAGKAAGSEDRN